MKGDVGPYMNDEGDVWVPRTVPYLEARKIAKEAIQSYGDRIVYVGKEKGTLYGFVRDCQCEGGCELRYPSLAGLDNEDTGDTGDDECEVPTWAFRIEE